MKPNVRSLARETEKRTKEKKQDKKTQDLTHTFRESLAEEPSTVL